MKTLFSVRNLSLSYQKKSAFTNVSMSIRQGQITALVGPSGCGKTSFLMTLNRLTDLIPGVSVTGEIKFGEVDVLGDSVHLPWLRRQVGMIFQRPNPFAMSIRKNMLLPIKEHGISQADQADDLIERALRDVGLWDEVKDRLDTSALALSGGQQQRLCFARALVLRPQVLLLDEPCSALDPIASGVVEDLIVKLKEKLTLVVVTHNLAQARRIADSVGVFWLHDQVGHLVELGSTHQIFSMPQDPITAAYVNGARG